MYSETDLVHYMPNVATLYDSLAFLRERNENLLKWLPNLHFYFALMGLPQYW
jgi:hypothetical protein